MIMSHHVGYYFKKPFRLPITFTQLDRGKMNCQYIKKWRVIIFFKQIWVQAVGLPKSFMSYLNFFIPDQTQPPDEKSIFQSFLFQLFWEVGINGNEICGNECTLLFRPEPLYSLLFLLYLMYPKLTKKLDNKILNPKKIGDWEQLTILDYNTFRQKKNLEKFKTFLVIKC